MKSIRIGLLLASLGSVQGSILAQDGTPRSPAVTLGRPAAEAPAESIQFMRSFVPIKRAKSAPPPTVVRGARPILEDDPLLSTDLGAPPRERRLPPAPKAYLPEATTLQNVVPTVPTLPAASNTAKPKPEVIQAPVRTLGLYETESVTILSDDEARSFLYANSDPTYYARAEYLLWWARGFHIPPLVTTAPATDPADTRGALGQGGTRILFGDSTVLQGLRSGGRFTLGWNCDPCGIYGIEASVFFLANKSQSATFNSDQFPVIGRPFFLLNTGDPSRELTTTPEFNTGNIRVNMSTSLWGAELNKRALLWCDCNYKFTGLVGFRYLNLSDHLNIEERSTFISDVPAPDPLAAPLFNKGDQTFVFDSFNTRNQFYGGQIGLDYTTRRSRFIFDAYGKLGLGVTQQTIDINGGQQITKANGTVQNFVGGLYAVNSNIGHFSQTRFGVVPEIGFRVGYDISSNVRIFAGYNFLYWSNVVRPGDQIDQTLDANRIPNAGGPFPAVNQIRPSVPFATTSYWAQGFTGGLEFRY